MAGVDQATGPTTIGKTSGDPNQWQRIDFCPARLSLRSASQIKVAIRTNGPSMTGLIRTPGGIAPNFNTGKGMTLVDLILKLLVVLVCLGAIVQRLLALTY